MKPGTALMAVALVLVGLGTFFAFHYSEAFEVVAPVRRRSSSTEPPRAVVCEKQQRKQKRRQFNFIGITSQKTKHLPPVMLKTWASRLPNDTRIHWYGEGEFDASLGHVTQVKDPVYLKALKKEDGYNFMTQKMLWVWNHSLHTLPEADWTIRIYDDNYVFLNSLYNELRVYNPDEPVLVGHRHYRDTSNYAYADGGQPWILSRAAARLWKRKGPQCLKRTLSVAKAKKLFGTTCNNVGKVSDANAKIWCAEDIYLWYCMRAAGIKFLHYRGESWFPKFVRGQQMEPYLWHSALGITSQSDLMMLPTYKLYYCALHPVDASLMQHLWKREREILKTSHRTLHWPPRR